MSIMKRGVFDLETDGLVAQATVVWCGVVKDLETGDVLRFGRDSIPDLLLHLSSFDVLIGHNVVGFDFVILDKLYGWRYNGRVADTLLMSRTQRPNRISPARSKSGPHSVESWGVRLGLDKVENEEWGVWSPLLMERCEQDVEIQVLIFEALMEEGRNEGWGPAHRLNTKLFHYLGKQERSGWHIDQALLSSNIHQLKRWIDMIASAINPSLPLVTEVLEVKKEGEYGYVKKPFNRSGLLSNNVDKYCASCCDCFDRDSISGVFSRILFRKLDINKTSEIKGYLLDQGWVPSEWNSNIKGERTSPKLSKNDPFIGVKGKVGMLIARRVQCKARLSILEGWQVAVRQDGRIPTPVTGIADTARLRHKSIVNVPSPNTGSFYAKQMRSVFTATPGWSMSGVDSKGNQARQLAARMKDNEFTDAVLNGDIHSLNQRKSGAETRAKAKNFFYGLMFGAGPANIATQLGIKQSEAKALIKRYMTEMPKLKELISKTEKKWEKTARRYYDKKIGQDVMRGGWITGVDGRRIKVDSAHKILCYQLQSDEAIQMSHAYVHLHEEMEKAGYVLGEDWRMLIWMHDEFQFEGRTNEIVQHAATLASESITWAGTHLNIECPHEGEALFGNNWSECH